MLYVVILSIIHNSDLRDFHEYIQKQELGERFFTRQSSRRLDFGETWVKEASRLIPINPHIKNLFVYIWMSLKSALCPSLLRHSCDRMCLGTGELLVVATIIITLLPSLASVPLLLSISYTLLHYLTLGALGGEKMSRYFLDNMSFSPIHESPLITSFGAQEF